MPKRQGKSTMPTVNINGRNRTYGRRTPSIETIGAKRISDEDKYAYYRVGERGLKDKVAANMMDIRESMARYAEEYGTQAQADEIRTWNLSRLKWLIDHDIIVVEEFFVYDDSNVNEQYGAKIPGSKTAEIQRTIDAYNQLYIEGRAVRQQRRRSRGYR